MARHGRQRFDRARMGDSRGEATFVVAAADEWQRGAAGAGAEEIAMGDRASEPSEEQVLKGMAWSVLMALVCLSLGACYGAMTGAKDHFSIPVWIAFGAGALAGWAAMTDRARVRFELRFWGGMAFL